MSKVRVKPDRDALAEAIIEGAAGLLGRWDADEAAVEIAQSLIDKDELWPEAYEDEGEYVLAPALATAPTAGREAAVDVRGPGDMHLSPAWDALTKAIADTHEGPVDN